jgi:cell division protein FtsB
MERGKRQEIGYKIVMKEIDFLPGWYKNGRRRQVGYRTQYVALGGVLVVMVVWNFIAANSISKAKAQSAQVAAAQSQAESASREFTDLKTQIAKLQKQAQSIEQIDSNIDVTSVLGELGYLIDKKIVLGKVEFVAEKFADKQAAVPGSSSVARAVLTQSIEKQAPLGDVRFKVVMHGIAAQAGDVAALICKLEDSPYFCQVVPSFSRNAEVKAANYPAGQGSTGQREEAPDTRESVRNADKDVQISEFEISCYLANYREQ